MSKLLTVLLTVILLSSCSTMDILKKAIGVSSGKGLSVDMQVGDREQEVQVAGARGTGKIVAKDKAVVTVNTSTASNRFEKAETVIIQNFNPWILGALLGVIILFIPSPLKHIKRFLLWLVNTPRRMLRKGSEQRRQ